jgi:hypothetical protein
MNTRRQKNIKIKKNKGTRKNKKLKTGKNWVTAIDAAQKTLEKTGSVKAARVSLRKQALYNARRLFGSIRV